jgi:hypothetical protein
VMYNDATSKWVMWLHIDDSSYAEVGLFQSRFHILSTHLPETKLETTYRF